MIRLCTDLHSKNLPKNWQGTYCSNRLQAYGLEKSYAPFYTDGQAVLSILDGNAVLCGEMLSLSEWATFLKMHSDVQSVNLSLEAAKRLGEELQTPVTIKPIMRLEDVPELPEISFVHPSPREMYSLLSDVFGETMPPFNNWYVDISHKIRHGLCHTIGVKQDGKLVSIAMTVALSEYAAVIGAVATAQTHRRRGFAAQCIRGLVATIYTKNPCSQIFISPKNEGAQRLYTSLGFTLHDQIGCIEF